MTAKRGEAKFKNDARFREWSFKCMQVIIEATHKNVFLGFDDESVRNLDRKMSPHERKKSQVHINNQSRIIPTSLNIVLMSVVSFCVAGCSRGTRQWSG